MTPTIRISKLKARRGTTASKNTVILDQGELGYATDTNRLFIGDGVTLGGSAVGSRVHTPLSNYTSLTSTKAEKGDLVNVNNKFYQLTAANYGNINSWVDVSQKLDPTVFAYDSTNRISLVSASISAAFLNSNSVSNGLKIESGILQTNFNTNSLELSSNKLSLKSGGITEREINASTFIKGISGGSGDKIGLNVDPDYFYFDGNTLSLSAVPTSSLVFSDIDSRWIGDGLTYRTDLSSSNSGTISLETIGLSANHEWSKVGIDTFGRVTELVSSIYGTLTGNSSLNGTNTLSSIFNGTPSHTLSGAIPGIPLTMIEVKDVFGVTQTLSSAGFITFEGNTTTRNGQTVGRFAIPIFAY